MIRALIVDDEPPARRKLRMLLEADSDVRIAGEAGTGAEALQALSAGEFDIAFLDVQMPGLTGFEVLERAGARPFVVVFVTAHDEFSLKAYEAEAFDYLLKPVDPLRFERVLQRAKEQIRLKREADLPLRLERLLARAAPPERFVTRYLVEERGRSFFVNIETVEWIEAARNYVALHVDGAAHVVRSTLDEFARRLDPDRFLRINRSQVVNVDFVREMRKWFHGEQIVVMKDGTELRWSRRFKTASSLE